MQNGVLVLMVLRDLCAGVGLFVLTWRGLDWLRRTARTPADRKAVTSVTTFVQPQQPVYLDSSGVARFQENTLVKHVMACAERGHPCDMNELAITPATLADRQQLAQLIGFSLSGYGALSYVDDAAWHRAEEARLALGPSLARGFPT